MFFSDKFGLFHVDFNDSDRKRTAKKSAAVFSQIIKNKKIPGELLSVEDSQWSSENFAGSEFNTLICRTVVSEFVKLMVMVTFIYQAVMFLFIQIYLVFICCNLARR